MVRPRDREQQKLYYSGKKKLHALKNIVLGHINCKVMFLSRTCEGKKHDKKAADQAGYQLPVGSTLESIENKNLTRLTGFTGQKQLIILSILLILSEICYYRQCIINTQAA